MTRANTSTFAAGHDASTPMQFDGRNLWQAAKRAAARIGRDRIGLVAAGVAFFALLAIFPGIAALLAIAGLVVDPEQVASMLESSTTALPPAAREILMGQVREVAGDGASGLNLAAIAGIAVAVYSASRGVANLIAGLNVAYEEEETRGFLALTALTLALTLFLLVAISVVIAALAVLPAVLSVVGQDETFTTVIEIARWPILLVVAATLFTVLYRLGPSRRAARWRWLAPGGALACMVWIAATAGFSWYVETLGSYAETFGALAGVIVLLLWLWLSAFAVLTGAVVDAELEHQTACDSTVGMARPMGERGAVKADSCAARDRASAADPRRGG